MLTKTVIENILIVLGESFWVFSAFAQLRRLLKTSDKLGLSPISQTANATGDIAWATYFASRHLWYPFATNIIIIALTILILGYTLTNKRQFSKGLLAIVIFGPTTSLLLLNFPHIAGWIGVLYNNIAAAPWLIHVIRTKKTSGISRHSLVWTYAAITFTFSYAILIISFPLMAGCLLGIFTTSIITRYYFRYHKHA
jgi:uncharacterized protein with PQ loop repeat